MKEKISREVSDFRKELIASPFESFIVKLLADGWIAHVEPMQMCFCGNDIPVYSPNLEVINCPRKPFYLTLLYVWCCLHREQALLTARREPILSRERVHERVRYPNVYDCYAEATKLPAFVGGARVSRVTSL